MIQRYFIGMNALSNFNIFHFLDCFAYVDREDGVLAHESVKTLCWFLLYHVSYHVSDGYLSYWNDSLC